MRPWIKSLILLVAVLLYVGLGALMFVNLERGQAQDARQKLLQAMAAFVANTSHCGMTDLRVHILLTEVAAAADQAGAFWAGAHPRTGIKPVWTFPNAFGFAFEVVTTIGQGIMVPRTFEGRLFCMFYALFGVPTCYLMLSVVGDTCCKGWGKIGRCISCISYEPVRLVLWILINILCLYTFLVTVPATIVSIREHMDFYSAQYYSFMILSTVGLGDMDTIKHHPFQWEVLFILYDLLCLSIISVVLKVLNMYRQHENDDNDSENIQTPEGENMDRTNSPDGENVDSCEADSSGGNQMQLVESISDIEAGKVGLR